MTGKLRRLVVALPDDRALQWLGWLGARPPDEFDLVACGTADALRDLDPEIVIGHQEQVLDLLAMPNARLAWVHLLTAGVEGALAAAGPGPHTFRLTRTSIHAVPMREYVLMAMLHFAKGVGRLREDQQARQWRPETPAMLAGRTLLCVGTGAIGTAVAEMGGAIGMRVLGVSRSGRPTPHFSTVFPSSELLEVLPMADHVVLALPLTADTSGLIGADAIAAMRPGTVLINIGRGALVDEHALLDALHGGRLGGAALDVFRQEPLAADSALWHAPNLLVTPHISGRMREGHLLASRLFLENLQAYLSGRPLTGLVDPQLGY